MKKLNQPVQLKAIIAALGGELKGDPLAQIISVSSLEKAEEGCIAFLSKAKYASMLKNCKAAAVILKKEHAAEYTGNAIFTDDPYLYYAKLTHWWKQQYLEQNQFVFEFISPFAHVHETAQVASTATVCAGAVIDAHAVVEEGAYIGAQSYIGKQVRIGEKTQIAPNVNILNGCKIGKRSVINSGAVIGGDGFGFAPSTEERRWIKIEQLGTVVIGDDVEIGVNTCVDRGALDDTIIGDGVKLDNLIQIGHNAHIGDDTLIASCSGVSGSTHIGKRCIIGGAVRTAGHLEIVDDVMIMGATNVTKSITKAGEYSGIVPFDEAGAWRKNAALFRHLSSMRDRIRELEKQVSELIKGLT